MEECLLGAQLLVRAYESHKKRSLSKVKRKWTPQEYMRARKRVQQQLQKLDKFMEEYYPE